jgi:DNA-binding winged helix-turn-helix (wHTH) protein/Tol biopolymer transport system component
MSLSAQPRGSDKLHFDVYEVDSRAGELRKHGYRVPLEDRPFRALEILLQHAPEVVTREELQKQLWPEDVFIDFDHGLNKAIGKVRRALNDSADDPRFVETVGRRGYRFIAPLARTPLNPIPVAVVDRQPTLIALKAPRLEAPAKEIRETRLRNWRPFTWAGIATVAVLLIAFMLRPESPKLQVANIVQITKSGEAWPLEPMATDGPRLYFQSLSNGTPSESPPDWRVKQVLLNGNEETVIPGTSSHIHSFRIRGLSSDDTEFLALSRVGETQEWFAATLPVVGGSPRRLGNLVADDVAWSHDGSRLAYTRGGQLFLANPDGTESRSLATVPGDIEYVSWSNDDQRLGFTVLTEQSTLWEVGSNGSGLHQRHFDWPGNAPEKAIECCGAWTPDGRYFVFRSRREGVSNLWAVQEKSSWWQRTNRNPVQLTFGPMNYYQPLPSRNGKTIFAVGTLPSGELVRYDKKKKDFLPILEGLSASHLEFSRDGKWIAYVTVPERTLWRARSDGSDAFQLTFPPLDVDSRPHWSREGKRIVFAARRPGELMRLYTVSATQGNPEMVGSVEADSQATPGWMPGENSLIYGRVPGVDNPSDIALYQVDLRTGRSKKIPGTDGLYSPLWSPDGHELAAVDATSERLFLVDVTAGKRTQLSRPAVFPIWSPDSQYLYFCNNDHEIFRAHVPDGHEEKVLDIPFRTASGSFGLAPDGVPIVLREHGHYDIYALSLAGP